MIAPGLHEHYHVVGDRDFLSDLSDIAVDKLVSAPHVLPFQKNAEGFTAGVGCLDLYRDDRGVPFDDEVDFRRIRFGQEIVRLVSPPDEKRHDRVFVEATFRKAGKRSVHDTLLCLESHHCAEHADIRHVKLVYVSCLVCAEGDVRHREVVALVYERRYATFAAYCVVKNATFAEDIKV